MSAKFVKRCSLVATLDGEPLVLPVGILSVDRPDGKTVERFALSLEGYSLTAVGSSAVFTRDKDL